MGIAAAIEGLVERVVLVERDEYVAAVWSTVTNGGASWLVDQVASFEMNSENLDAVFERKDKSTRDMAFAMLIHNRISRGGITALGAGRLNAGERGRGILSRWYPDTLVKRIEQIAAAKERITFVEDDAFHVVEQYAGSQEAAFFLDPPYAEAGQRLYRHSDVNAKNVFQEAAAVRGDVLITYDDSAEINRLVDFHNLQSRPMLMPTTHHQHKLELLIGKNLQWIDD